jgi:HD superfamily phosphohydrolase YqeK
MKLASENNIAIRTEYDKIPLFLHGPVGACYIVQKLGMKDAIILDAISRHSYFGEGAALSPVFCWCLRFADMLEPSRDWVEIRNQITPFVYAGGLAKAAYLLVKWIIPFHEASSLPIHPNIHRLVKELSAFQNGKTWNGIHDLPV